MKTILAGLALAIASPTSAEVVSAGPNGFEVRHSANLVVPAAQAFAAFTRVGAWWHDDHTYSGKASNMRLALQPGGCFCEQLPGGGVEHMRVAVVQPGERIVLTGSLGPLLFEATAGVMDVQVERIAGGSRLTMTYRAAGFAKGGAAEMAPAVDRVLGEQIKRYRAYAAAAGKTR
jgi:hypothetical protein